MVNKYVEPSPPPDSEKLRSLIVIQRSNAKQELATTTNLLLINTFSCNATNNSNYYIYKLISNDHPLTKVLLL